MGLDGVHGALSESISNQQIDLYGAARSKSALEPLQSVLALFNINSSWTLTGAVLARPPGSVTFTGKGTWALADGPTQSNVAVSLVVTSADGIDLFELSLAIADTNWTFATTFLKLPQTQVYQKDSNSIRWTESFFNTLPLANPVLSAQNKTDLLAPPELLHLSGFLSPFSAIADYLDLFASWPMRVDGTMVLPATANGVPSIDLTAISPSLTFSILDVTFHDVGLNLLCVNDLLPLDWGRTAFSVINVVGVLDFGTIHAEAAVTLLASGEKWRFFLGLDPPAGIGGTLAEVGALFGLPPAVLWIPEGFDEWTGFGITEIDFVVQRPAASRIVPSIDTIAITLRSSKQWNPPIPYVRVRDVGTKWVVGWTPVGGVRKQYVSGSVFGSLAIGSGTQPPRPRSVISDNDPLPVDGNSLSIDVVAYVPRFAISGRLRSGDTIPIGDAFTYFFGNPGPATKPGMAITDFSFFADPDERTYDASADMTMDWEVPLLGSVSISLVGLSMIIGVTQGSISGAIAGDFLLKSAQPDDPNAVVPRFYAGASYDAANAEEGWIFRCGLYPNTNVDLLRLVFNFIDVTPPASLPPVTLDALSVEFTTGSNRYQVAGRVVGRWTPTLFDKQLNISAMASVDIRRDTGAANAVGTLTGRFAINKIAVEVGISLSVDEPTYRFRVEFGEIWFQAVTGWRGESKPRHQVITFQLGGITLGGILEYLVNLAAPTIGFKLEPPWDALNRIDLSRFAVTVDPTESTIELTYAANVDLVIMRIDTIGVRYLRADGEGTVDLILYGKFLGKDYTQKPLAWDVVNDPPPSIGAAEEVLLEVRYIGVGQRVTPRTEFPKTVRGSLDQLALIMRPPDDTKLNPLKQPTGDGLKFSAESEWLIGIDLSILDTLDLGIIFNDPKLYGLSIALRGERAGALAGLYFEILYKKITDDIGMFRIELRLPEAFRHYEFGEVSITLGIIVVEIYTDGNFLVDFGFPYDRNFDRSFSVQVFPFIGRGGIYFGVLNGSTSTRVPRITNGTFSPVLELGIGLAVGVGKEVTLGPLSGGIFVQVEVIFQGVLGWFNPASSAVAPAKYYWAQGVAAIHGKLYGKVDFVIIKVSATVEAYAQASVVFEAYKPALFRLDVGVSVEAEIDFTFFSISFSFSATLDVSFSVGRESPTPWIVDGSPPSGAGRLASGLRDTRLLPPAARRADVRERRLVEEHLSNVRLARRQPLFAIDTEADDACAAYVLTWMPTLAVFANPARRPIGLTMLPAFSLTEVPVAWGTTAAPLNPNPQYRIAFTLFAENGRTPHASFDERGKRSAANSAKADETNELPSDILIEGLLRWSIAAITGSPGNDPTKNVTAGQIALLLDQLGCPQTYDAFSVANLGTFLQTNAPLQIAGDPGGNPTQSGAMFFPMPPPIFWTSAQAGNINFGDYNKVGPLYEWGVSKYIAPFFPDDAIGTRPSDDPAAYESFASYVFRDYFLMIAKGAVQAARDLLQSWSVVLTADSSLSAIANRFPTATITYLVRSGDTIDNVAAAVGASVAELEFLNPTLVADLAGAAPGTTLPMKLGVSPESVAIDNATVALDSALTFNLGSIDYQVRAGDTLTFIATHFHLSGATALLAGTGTATDPLLLRAGSSFATPSITYTPPPGTPQVLTAATFFVRFYTASGIPYDAWYAQTIFDLNQHGKLKDVDYDMPIPPNTLLSVPAAYGDPSSAIHYTSIVGDTVTQIGASLSLAQNFATGDLPSAAWKAFRDGTTSSGASVTMPAALLTIEARDTLSALATRTIVNSGNTANLVQWLADADVLNALAFVTVPNVVTQPGDGANIAALASYYGIGIGEFGSRVATPPQSVFRATQTITIHHLPVQSIDTLVSAVLAGSAPADISATTSRYLLSGLRVPAPVTEDGHVVATGPLKSMYDLTGQQFAGPAPAGTGPLLEVTVEVTSGTRWITLVDSLTVSRDETYDALVARYPNARDRRFNRGLRVERMREGVIVVTGVASQLVFTYDAAGLQYPATGLAIPVAAPAPMGIAAMNPRTYGLDHRVPLQTATALPIPVTGSAPATGIASLWPFPAPLVQRALAGTTTKYDILLSAHGSDGSAAIAVEGSTYATLLPFIVRRVAGRDHIYDVVGAASSDRAQLRALWQYLASKDTPGGTKAFLLVSPAPDSGNASGLANLALDLPKTFIVKTNLSTETKHDAAAIVPPTRESNFAGFADLAHFIRLLWEGSVVGGAGYYFGVSLTGGADLPASAFIDGENATMQLFVIAGEQQSTAPSGRALLSINNIAVVAPGLDGAVHALYVEAAEEVASELTTVATVPPGSVGFTLELPIPVGATGEPQLQRLFSLASTSATGTFAFEPSGLPASPQRDTSGGQPLWKRRRMERWQRQGRAVVHHPTPQWKFDQVIPITRFGPPSIAPLVSGLPDPSLDPYRGIGGATLQTANIVVGFSDVLGNITAAPSGQQGRVAPAVGYTDPLLGISSWPGVTMSYDVTSDNVLITLASQPGAIAPSPMASAKTAIGAAANQAEKYLTPYFQLAQPNVQAFAVTTLKSSTIEVDLPTIWRFAAANYAAAMNAALLVPKIPAGKLSDVVSMYAVTYDAIAAANEAQTIESLFAVTSLTVPVYVHFADGDTANGIVATLPSGWPRPSDGAALLTQNSTLPLRIAVQLSIPSVTLTIPAGTPSLATIAASNHTLPALLAADSAADANILAANFTFVMDGVEVVVGVTTCPPNGTVVNTIADVVAAYRGLGVNITAEDIGAAYADAPAMLVGGGTMHNAHYIALDADTLAANASGATPADLATRNAGTPDVFDSGALIFLGNVTGTLSSSGVPETLHDFAARYSCPSSLLLEANAALTLPAATTLVVPGTATLPQVTTSIAVPYTIAANDDLNRIAANFSGASASALATANRYLPGTIASGRTIAVSGFSTQTQTADSFDSVWRRLNDQSSSIQFGDLISAIDGTAGDLAAGGLLIAPLAKVAGNTNLSPDAISATYHVTGVAFAQANAALLGIIANAVDLWNGDRTIKITTGANDTFNSLVSRFAQAGVHAGIDELVTANHDINFILAGALALLPPATVRVEAALGGTIGPFANPITPLTVALRIQRPAAVIDPAFSGSAEVASVDATVPAPAAKEGTALAGELTLIRFVNDFQTAFPNVRIATGKVPGENADLWLVDFSSTGIASIKVAPGVPVGGNLWPRFFALRPLYNALVQRVAVALQALAPDGTLDPVVASQEFHDVDVEVWAQRFLADVDLFLSAPYAAAVYANDAARATIDMVMAAKGVLSPAIARGLAATLVLTDPNAAPGRGSAIDALEQQLDVSLSRAYATSAIVQYDAAVDSPWTRGAKLPPARLAGTIVHQANGGASPEALPYTMTGAKTKLDQASSFINFLMRVPDPAHTGAIEIDLQYDYLDLEFDISSVAGYESSNWVSFVDRLTNGDPTAISTALGSSVVPIPLRNYPALPTFIGQTATPTWTMPGAPPLDQASLWTYGLAYTHEHALQDEVQITTAFNVVAQPMSAAAFESADVATELAKYIHAADALWAILSGFADPATTIDPSTLANAASTFATFVTNVGTAWDARWAVTADEARSDVVPPSSTYSFGAHVTYAAAKFSTFELTKQQRQPGPSNQWPSVFYLPPDGDPVPLSAGTPSGDLLVYSFPAVNPIEAIPWPRFRIEWASLNVAAFQNARGSLAVKRNARLLGTNGPATAADFQYQTGTIDAADIATPLLKWPQLILLAGTDVTAALDAAFGALFGTASGMPLTVAMYYGYQLVAAAGAEEGINIYLPVSIYPNQLLTSTTAATIAGALTTWDRIYSPTHDGGLWAFSLTLYSQLPDDAARPLLVLERMVFPIAG